MIWIWKHRYETMGQMMHRAGLQYPEKMEKATFAGRLDPMASGLVPVIFRDALDTKDAWLACDKTYSVDVLLGVGTDTGDMLGMPARNITEAPEYTWEQIQKATHRLVGAYAQPYPAFSSKVVQGKPLWLWARDDKENMPETPTKDVQVHTATPISMRIAHEQEIREEMIKATTHVEGDFRQQKIIDAWSAAHIPALPVVRVVMRVSSGTYIRLCAERLGEYLGVPALSYQLIRTSVGDADVHNTPIVL